MSDSNVKAKVDAEVNANANSNANAKAKSVVVWNYEILLVLTGLFSLWNYGSISMMTMGERNTDAAGQVVSETTSQVSSQAPVDGNVFVFTVMATGAAITLLALMRFIFRTHFSKKMLHSPMLLVVFSIPILLLVFFIGLMFGVRAVS